MRHDPANMHVNITESLVNAGTGISAGFTDFTPTVLQDLGLVQHQKRLPLFALRLSSILVRPARGRVNCQIQLGCNLGVEGVKQAPFQLSGARNRER